MSSTRTSAVDEVLALRTAGEAHAHSFAELLPVQLRALDERLAERRGQIRVLDQRATDAGISGIDSLQDVVPLLFAHMTYKSYPDRFVQRGEWPMLNRWLATLATRPVADMDFDGIRDVDGWLGRLDAEGHHVRVSSGTQGKASFLNWSDVDLAYQSRTSPGMLAWSFGIDVEPVYPIFLLIGAVGFRTYVDSYHHLARAFGRPDARYFLSDVVERVGDINRLGAIRKAMIEGTASPADVQDVEARSQRQSAEMVAAMDRLVDRLLQHHGEPVIIRGPWAQLYRLMTAAKRRGIGDGELCTRSYVQTAGGKKGIAVDGDYEPEIRRFFSGSTLVNSYGMSEWGGVSGCPQCPAGRCHVPAELVPVMLDDSGEALAPHDGLTQAGRLGAFDLTLDGRWGGVISSDFVQMHYDRCPCGAPSTSISSIGRLDGQDDDKLTCAGTIEAYVRGIIDV